MSNDLTLKNKLDTNYKVKGYQLANATVKDVDTKKRSVDIIVNSFNYLDSDMDVLMSGCAMRSIKARGVNSDATAKIKFALDHDLTKRPGVWTDLGEKEWNYKGQKITGIGGTIYLSDTKQGNDTLINYNDGVIDNHSIGFQYSKIDMIERDAHGNSKQWDNMMQCLINPNDVGDKTVMFAVKEINLFEGSAVAFGANQLTPFLGVKSNDKDLIKLKLFDRLDTLQSCLKSGHQSDDMMHVFELQILQLKQLIDEMNTPVIDEKALAIERGKLEAIDKQRKLDAIKNFDFGIK
jgi:Caudovirus prohead serine protease